MVANRPWTHGGRGAVWAVIPLALALSAPPAHAQASVTIDQLGFMAGHWTRTTETSANSATFEERTAGGSLYLRYRVTESGQLGIAVGSPEDFQSDTFTESLHDRVR